MSGALTIIFAAVVMAFCVAALGVVILSPGFRPAAERLTTAVDLLKAEMVRALPAVETIYGKDGVHRTPYLTRMSWGPFFLHVFHRGDADPDPHDHRRPFWTLPLTSYVEDVLLPPGHWVRQYAALRGQRADKRLSRAVVEAFRIHHRPAEHCHRIVGRWSGESIPGDPGTGRFPLDSTRPGRIVTLGMWDRRAEAREWGFWTDRFSITADGSRWRFVPWRRYVFGDGRPPDQPGAS